MLKDLINNNVIRNIRRSTKESIVVEISVTDKCNCRCKYCFEQDQAFKPIDVNEQNRQLDLLIELCESFDPSKYKDIQIIFWGGEPMCNSTYIEQLIDKTQKYEFVHYFMYTNGTLVDEFKRLISSDVIYKNKDRFAMQFSYDGEPHHKLMRGDNSDKMLESAKLMFDNGFNISFKATLSFDMLQYFPKCWKSYEKLYEQFGDIVYYFPTLDTTKTDMTNEMFQIWKESIIEVLKYEYSFIRKHNRPLLSWLKGINQEIENKASCSLNNHIMVSTSGDIYICHGCQYSKHKNDFKLGNTKDINSFYDVIKPLFSCMTFKLPKACERCGATFCNICHVAQVNSINYINDWIECRYRNKMRCKFFKLFGQATNALKLALIKEI